MHCQYNWKHAHGLFNSIVWNFAFVVKISSIHSYVKVLFKTLTQCLGITTMLEKENILIPDIEWVVYNHTQFINAMSNKQLL